MIKENGGTAKKQVWTREVHEQRAGAGLDS